MIKGSVKSKIKLPNKNDLNSFMKKFIAEWVFRAQKKVKADKLTGQVLNVKTGNLRRSINVRFSSDGLAGYVGTNVDYGMIHEYGLEMVIREHMRVMTKVFGVSVEPFEVTVAQQVRKAPERSFLRSTLKEIKDPMMQDFKLKTKEFLNGF